MILLSCLNFIQEAAADDPINQEYIRKSQRVTYTIPHNHYLIHAVCFLRLKVLKINDLCWAMTTGKNVIWYYKRKFPELNRFLLLIMKTLSYIDLLSKLKLNLYPLLPTQICFLVSSFIFSVCFFLDLVEWIQSKTYDDSSWCSEWGDQLRCIILPA